MSLVKLDNINRGDSWEQWISGRTAGVTLESFFKEALAGNAVPPETAARVIEHTVTEGTDSERGGDGWYFSATTTQTEGLEKKPLIWGIIRSDDQARLTTWLGIITVEYGA